MLRFTLIDYTYTPAGNSTVIDEPVGWDAINMRLKRDETWHGFFDFIDDSASTSLQFDGVGRQILGAAYDEDGAEAEVHLLIEYYCGDVPPSYSGNFEELYRGRCVFSRYKNICGDRCYVEVGIENTSCVMAFKNRYDQKVDLDSLTPFDEVCEDISESAGAVGEFTAPDTVVILGEIPGLTTGKQFTISGTTNNNGIYTVLENTYNSLLAETTIIIEEGTFVNEGPLVFTITGCLNLITLPAYDNLNRQVIVPAKVIQFKNHWQITPYTFTYEDEFGTATAIAETKFYFIPFEWDRELLTEIKDSDPISAPYAVLGSAPGSPNDTFKENNDGIIKLNISEDIVCRGQAEIRLRMQGEVNIQSNDGMSFSAIIGLTHGNDTNGYTDITLQSGFGCVGCNTVTTAIDIDYSNSINLKDGDRIYLSFIITDLQYTTGGGGGGPTDPFVLTMDIDYADLQVIIDTQCEKTPAKVYLINETMSRISEAYTNDCLRVYSDYFGRTDAQPYPSETTGCGGLESITSGLKIRAKDVSVKIGDSFTEPKVTASMKEVFEGMNAIHNIGMGLETDTNRSGYELIRVEPVRYFYKDDVLMTCDEIAEAVREVDMRQLFSIFRTGYAKWETENVNGLNDVFGKREYRTLLNQIRNTHERICNFIASDYAIEITRRKYGLTTTDWKYDNDIFVLCLTSCIKLTTVTFNAGTNNIVAAADGIYDNVEVGDTISFEGSAFNDGSFTVTVVNQIDENVIALTFAESLTSELANNVTMCNLTNPFKIVETDNVVNSTNILHPDTCMNLRITPARNAMRHFKTILSSYRNFAENGILKFTNGDGNYLAQIELDNLTNCLLENRSCDSGSGSAGGSSTSGSDDGNPFGTELLPENGDITLETFSCPEEHFPIHRPELIKFEYPCTWEQYKIIKANPYGLIYFGCGGPANEYGWIEDFQLKPEGPNGGLATFIIKPKIPV